MTLHKFVEAFHEAVPPSATKELNPQSVAGLRHFALTMYTAGVRAAMEANRLGEGVEVMKDILDEIINLEMTKEKQDEHTH
jgi:hypothetical protein